MVLVNVTIVDVHMVKVNIVDLNMVNFIMVNVNIVDLNLLDVNMVAVNMIVNNGRRPPWWILTWSTSQSYMQKTCDVAEKAILAKKNLRKKCVNRDKM